MDGPLIWKMGIEELWTTILKSLKKEDLVNLMYFLLWECISAILFYFIFLIEKSRKQDHRRTPSYCHKAILMVVLFTRAGRIGMKKSILGKSFFPSLPSALPWAQGHVHTRYQCCPCYPQERKFLLWHFKDTERRSLSIPNSLTIPSPQQRLVCYLSLWVSVL